MIKENSAIIEDFWPIRTVFNVTELTSMAMLKWSKEMRVAWHYTLSGMPPR